MTHLLDTSALLAHAFQESGWECVQALLDDPATEVAISALSFYEADRRLVAIGVTPGDRHEFMARWTAILDLIAPVDESVVRAACELRERLTGRLATVDMLIAATASVHKAILVHRDAHFAAIPAEHLQQRILPEK